MQTEAISLTFSDPEVEAHCKDPKNTIQTLITLDSSPFMHLRTMYAAIGAVGGF